MTGSRLFLGLALCGALAGAALVLSVAPALASELRGGILVASYDLKDLVPDGPESAKQVTALVESIKTKVNPEAWKPGKDNSIAAGDREMTISTADASLVPLVREHLLGLYAAGMPAAHKEMHEKLAKRAPLDFKDAHLGKALESLAKASGLRIELDADCRGKAEVPVTLRTKEASYGLAVRQLARAAGLEWSFRDGGVVLAKPVERAPKPLHRLFADARIDKEVADDLRDKLSWSKVSFDWDRKPSGEALKFLADAADVRIVPDGPGEHEITLRMQDASVETALKWVCRLCKLEYRIRDGAVHVRPVD